MPKRWSRRFPCLTRRLSEGAGGSSWKVIHRPPLSLQPDAHSIRVVGTRSRHVKRNGRNLSRRSQTGLQRASESERFRVVTNGPELGAADKELRELSVLHYLT